MLRVWLMRRNCGRALVSSGWNNVYFTSCAFVLCVFICLFICVNHCSPLRQTTLCCNILRWMTSPSLACLLPLHYLQCITFIYFPNCFSNANVYFITGNVGHSAQSHIVIHCFVSFFPLLHHQTYSNSWAPDYNQKCPFFETMQHKFHK